MKVRALLILVPALVYAAGLFSGCATSGGRGELIGGVPGDAVVVKVVNLEFLLKDAGCAVPVSDGALKPRAGQIVGLVAEPDFRGIFTRLLAVGKEGGADMSEVVSFTTASGRDIMSFGIDDAGAFCRAMGCEAEKADMALEGTGLLRASVDGMAMVMDRSRCWIAADEACIKEALEHVGKGSFGSLTGVHEFLESSRAAKLAVNCGRSSLSFLGDAGKWLCVGFDVTEASVSAEAVVMDRDGRLDSIGRNFQEIDTDFLRYTPNDAAVVLAFGKFKGNVRGLGMLLGRFAPVYLSQADGTTSLYAVPASGRVESVAEAAPGSWNVETMVHVPEELIQVGLGQYRERAVGKVRNLGGQWTYSEGDDSYYFGAFDGCLVFSTNREISADYNNAFAESFLGRRAAMVVDVAAGSVLAKAWGLPFGLSFRLGVDAMRVKARIAFNGSDENALCSLLRLPQLPDFKERFRMNTAR